LGGEWDLTVLLPVTLPTLLGVESHAGVDGVGLIVSEYFLSRSPGSVMSLLDQIDELDRRIWMIDELQMNAASTAAWTYI